MDPGVVLERRRAERAALLEKAERFAAGLDPALGVVAVVVIGSVARGDFNRWSDVDVLVVAEHLPLGWQERLDALGVPPSPVQPVAWSPAEWRTELGRANAMAREAVDLGVWLVGDAGRLADG